jgi:hypothetical protein
MALPFALFAMVAATGLASAAVMSSVNVQQGSHRDSDAKKAIAAADAGANIALMRLNRYSSALSVSPSSNCLGVNGGGSLVVTAATKGWCPPIGGTVGDASYSYETSAMVNGVMGIASTGSAGDVSRRILVALTGGSPSGVLGEEGLIGQEKLTMSGNVENIRVSVGTNGDVNSSGNVGICGNVRHGVGKDWIKSGNVELSCGGVETEGNITLPPVESFMPADIATKNSNYRLVKCSPPGSGVPAGCQTDTYSGTIWNSGSRTLSISGNQTVTLGGEDYWLCKLSVSGNTHLAMAANSHVRLFFDTPENCGLSGSQVSFSGNTNIEATGYKPELGRFDMPGIYLLGSPTIKTTVSLSGNGNSNQLVLYGPNTEISVSGNSDYKGVIAGKTLTMSGNGYFEQDDGFEPPLIGGAKLYSRQSYVECIGIASTSPSENC